MRAIRFPQVVVFVNFLLFGVLPVSVFLGMPSTASGQAVVQLLSGEEYSLLLDTIFPRRSANFDPLLHEYAVDVRMQPSFSAPHHVSLVKFHDGKIETVSYTLSSNDESLGNRVSSLLEKGGRRDVPFLAAQLEIKKGTPDPKVLTKALDELRRCIRIEKQDFLTLDGVGFSLWYVDSGSSFTVTLTGGEKYEKGESPLITVIRRMALSR